MDYIKLLTNQLIEHKQENKNSPRFSEQERKINETVSKILNETIEIDSLDPLIKLREVFQFLTIDKDQISALDKKLITISQHLSESKNILYDSITQHGWENHWKEYNEFIDLFPMEHQNEILLHSVNEALAFLDSPSKASMKIMISEATEMSRKDFFRNIVSLIGNIPINDRPIFLQIISTNTPEDQATIIEQAKLLITDGMLAQDKCMILEKINSIAPEDRASVIEHAKLVITNRMLISERIYVLRTIAKIAPKDRASVVEQAILLFTDDITGTGRSTILDCIGKIASEDRASIIEQAKLLFTDDITNINKSIVLNSIRDIASEDRKNVIEHAKLVITNRMLISERIYILRTIAKIAPKDRASVVEQAILLFTDDMTTVNKAQILTTIEKISSEHRASAIEHAKLLFTDGMAGENKALILKSIMGIAPEDWVSVIEHAKLLFTNDMTGENKAFILEIIGKIDSEDRASVIEHAKLLFTNDMTGANKALILKSMGTIVAENRLSVIEHTKLLITDGMSAPDKTKIFETISDIDFEEQLNVIECAKSLITNDMLILTKTGILEAIADLAPEERVDVIAHVKNLFVHGVKDIYKSSIIKAIGAIPLEERENVIEKYKILLTNIPDLFSLDPFSNLNAFDTVFVLYLLPNHLKTLEKLSNLEGSVLNDSDCRLGIIASLEEKMANPQIAPSTTNVLARFIYNKKDDLQLHDEHPLLQKAIEIISATEVEGKKNPFTIYKKLKELQKQPINFQTESKIVNDISVSISLENLKNARTSVEITRENMPPKATLEAWNTLRENLKGKIEGQKDLEEALASYGTSWNSIWYQSLNDAYLSGLLSLSGDTVSFTEAKFRQILNNVLAKETKEREGNPFTEQEEVLIKAAMTIQNCPGGKQEGIDLIYGQLEPEYRYQTKLPDDVQKEALQALAFQSISEIVKDFISNQFRGNNPPLMKALIGMGDIDIKEGTHQAIYAKNLLAPVLGLDHNLIFDQHTGVLYDSLIERTRDEALKIVFDIITPEALVKELKRAVNSSLHNNSIIQFASSEANPDDFLELEDDDVTLRLLEKGSLALLLKAGYFIEDKSHSLESTHLSSESSNDEKSL